MALHRGVSETTHLATVSIGKGIYNKHRQILVWWYCNDALWMWTKPETRYSCLMIDIQNEPVCSHLGTPIPWGGATLPIMRNEDICNFKSLYLQSLSQSDGSRYETEIAENALSTMKIIIFIATFGHTRSWKVLEWHLKCGDNISGMTIVSILLWNT